MRPIHHYVYARPVKSEKLSGSARKGCKLDSIVTADLMFRTMVKIEIWNVVNIFRDRTWDKNVNI